MASDHPCNSVFELHQLPMDKSPCKVWHDVAKKTGHKMGSNTSKNKPLKLLNLWYIPAAQVPIQESMKGPVHWSEKYQVIHLTHIASQGN